MAEYDLKVAVIGGGTGLSTILRGLKRYPIDITAIVTVADDGGSSGSLRCDFDVPPPGDIRNVLVALSEVEPLVQELFQYRFKGETDLAGHPTGNLLIAAMTNITGDFASAVQKLSEVLKVRGRVLPVCNTPLCLCAEYDVVQSFRANRSFLQLRKKLSVFIIRKKMLKHFMRQLRLLWKQTLSYLDLEVYIQVLFLTYY